MGVCCSSEYISFGRESKNVLAPVHYRNTKHCDNYQYCPFNYLMRLGFRHSMASSGDYQYERFNFLSFVEFFVV